VQQACSGFLNSAGTRITAVAFSRVQSRLWGVIATEPISTHRQTASQHRWNRSASSAMWQVLPFAAAS